MDPQATNRAWSHPDAGREPRMYRLLMRPSNAVCDAMHVTDENERGMIRMLVNMLLLSLVAVVGFVVLVGNF